MSQQQLDEEFKQLFREYIDDIFKYNGTTLYFQASMIGEAVYNYAIMAENLKMIIELENRHEGDEPLWSLNSVLSAIKTGNPEILGHFEKIVPFSVIQRVIRENDLESEMLQRYM